MTCVRNVCRTHDSADLFHAVEVWGQASMHAEDLLVDDGSDREAVEAIGEGLPNLYVVSPLTCTHRMQEE